MARAGPSGSRDAGAGGIRPRERDAEANAFPDAFPPLPKMGALEKSAQYLEQKFYRTPINVTFEDQGQPRGCAAACLHDVRRLRDRLQLRR